MQMSVTRWMDKQKMVYPCIRMLFGHRNEVVTHTVRWMMLEDMVLRESSQTWKIT